MKKTKTLHVITFGLLITCWCYLYSSTASAALREQNTPTLASMLEKVMPAVVNVTAQSKSSMVTSDNEASNNEEDSHASPPPQSPNAKGNTPENRKNPEEMAESIGSGVIIDAKKGYVLTNAHLLRDTSTVTVTLTDGRHIVAKKIGIDPASDIAVLKIDASNLTAMPMGDSDKLHVGDPVVAIGNPFGLNRFGPTSTVTSGIVSALNRSGMAIESYENFIQTDASINPGNSGGALVSFQGQLIGINTAILAPGGGNIGIGFAIPINMAESIMHQLIKYGAVRRGLLGILVQPLTPEIAHAMGTPDQKGALIAKVNASSPAERAGLKPGDIVVKMNNQKIDSAVQVRNSIGLLRVGDSVALDILRDGKTFTATTKIVDPHQHEEQQQKRNTILFGVALKDFAEESPYHGSVKGVQVTGLMQTSPAWRSGLRPGDVITSANRKPVTNIASLENIAKQNHSNELLLLILRGPGAAYLVIK